MQQGQLTILVERLANVSIYRDSSENFTEHFVCKITSHSCKKPTAIRRIRHLAVHQFFQLKMCSLKKHQFYLSLLKNHHMVSILGACNFYCVFLVIRLTRVYYCQCCVTINCIIYQLKISIINPSIPRCHDVRRVSGGLGQTMMKKCNLVSRYQQMRMITFLARLSPTDNLGLRV